MMPSLADESRKEQQKPRSPRKRTTRTDGKENDGGETKTRLLNWEPYLAAKTQYSKLLGY